jgi:hypothetical protein
MRRAMAIVLLSETERQWSPLRFRVTGDEKPRTGLLNGERLGKVLG